MLYRNLIRLSTTNSFDNKSKDESKDNNIRVQTSITSDPPKQLIFVSAQIGTATKTAAVQTEEALNKIKQEIMDILHDEDPDILLDRVDIKKATIAISDGYHYSQVVGAYDLWINQQGISTPATTEYLGVQLELDALVQSDAIA